MMIKMQTSANECEKTSEATQKPIVRITADVITPFLNRLSKENRNIGLRVNLLGNLEFAFEECKINESEIQLSLEYGDTRGITIHGDDIRRKYHVIIDKSVNLICDVCVYASSYKGFSLVAKHIDFLLSYKGSKIMSQTITKIYGYYPSHNVACTKLIEDFGSDYERRPIDSHQKMYSRYLKRQRELASLSLFCHLFSRYHCKADLE